MDENCEDDFQMIALKRRSTQGWHVTGAIVCGATLAGLEMYWMKTMALAVAFMPIVASLVAGYQETKRNGKS